MPSDCVWVADIGGSHITAALVELIPGHNVVARVRMPINPHDDSETLLSTICGTLQKAGPAARAWTIALPGPFDYDRGTGTFDGVAKLAALAGLDLRYEIAARLAVDARNVSFLNDASAYGLGEWAASPHRIDRFACFTLGTGIGSAFLDHGKSVTEGPSVPPFGRADLITIDGVPLEDVVSTRAIRNRYRQRSGDDIDVRAIAERATNGDAAAHETLTAAMRDLGTAIAPAIHRFGATEVVIGGSMARSWDLLGTPLTQAIMGAGARAHIHQARLLDDAPLVGAAIHSRHSPDRHR